jgi:hypothetical protein
MKHITCFNCNFTCFTSSVLDICNQVSHVVHMKWAKTYWNVLLICGYNKYSVYTLWTWVSYILCMQTYGKKVLWKYILISRQHIDTTHYWRMESINFLMKTQQSLSLTVTHLRSHVRGMRDWFHCALLAAIWPILPAPDDDECGISDRGNRSTWRKPAPVSPCPLQISHDLTCAATVGSWQLTAWSAAQS